MYFIYEAEHLYNVYDFEIFKISMNYFKSKEARGDNSTFENKTQDDLSLRLLLHHEVKESCH